MKKWLWFTGFLAVYLMLCALAACAAGEGGAPAEGPAEAPAESSSVTCRVVTELDGQLLLAEEDGGGIYDVAKQFKAELEALGITVALDTSSHLPHDGGAYRRSRQTAVRLAEKAPDALIDIHRDGIPDPDEYTHTVAGDPVAKVRLLVGRANQNSAANRSFAKQIKAVADKMYPGLIKDIFIGKGNYNQEIMPHAILLEFGTHTISKERALASTELMANVLNKTLYGDVSPSASGGADTGGSAAARTDGAADSSEGAGSGVVWLLLVAGACLPCDGNRQGHERKAEAKCQRTHRRTAGQAARQGQAARMTAIRRRPKGDPSACLSCVTGAFLRAPRRRA